LIFATVAFVLALLAKPSAVVVPVMAWLLANAWGKQGNVRPTSRNPCLLLAAWVIIAVPFIVVTNLAQGTSIGFVTPLWARPLVAGDALSFYFYKLLVPFRLGIDYGRSPDFLLQHDWALITGLVPWALGGVLWLFRDRAQWLLASAAVFVVGLLPALGLMPFGFQNYSTVADRYLYLPMLGPSMVVAWLVSHRPLWINKRLVVGICILVSSLLGIRSSFQIQHWHSNTNLFQHALQVNPNSSVSHNNYGSALSELGKIAEAIVHYREAVRIRPNNAEAHNNLGIALVSKGNLRDAIGHFMKAIGIRPDFADAHYNLGIALSKKGKLADAIAHYEQGLQIQPDDLEAHNNLGNALLEEGKIEEAIFHYQEVLRMASDNSQARQNLSVAMAMKMKSE
jgi:Flp pilus assembly protein TadD